MRFKEHLVPALFQHIFYCILFSIILRFIVHVPDQFYHYFRYFMFILLVTGIPVQTLLLNAFSARLSKGMYFLIVLVIELLLINIIFYIVLDGEILIVELYRSIFKDAGWDDISVTLYPQLTVIPATLLTILVRYKKFAAARPVVRTKETRHEAGID